MKEEMNDESEYVRPEGFIVDGDQYECDQWKDTLLEDD